MGLARRSFLQRTIAALGALAAGTEAARVQARPGRAPGGSRAPAASAAGRRAGDAPVPVVVPDVPGLPFEMDDGVKVFRLVAEPVRAEFVPGRVVDVWGYSGSMPGPTIEVNEGDRVRILFENRLPEPQTVHWHGLEVPIAMDGVPAISQPPVAPGASFTYEFTVNQNGTFFYHTHMPMAEMIGLIGFFIVHPWQAHHPLVHRDFGIILQEWAVLPSNTVPNTLSMEFNWLTFNGKAGPAATPLLVKQGERVRIRIVNLGMDHHPIHLHGFQFRVTGTEAGRIPESAWYPQNTVLVGVAQARDIEFDAVYPGDWMLHCHLPHHMMNQMVSMVGPLGHWGHTMQTGRSMEAGMGIVKGAPLSEGSGPALGRGMGLTRSEQPTSALVGPSHGHDAAPVDASAAPSGRGAGGRVPGHPQDMWMPMDEEVSKPETWGLPKDWSAALGGMMTLVRVLPPDRYEEIMGLVKDAAPRGPTGTERHRH